MPKLDRHQVRQARDMAERGRSIVSIAAYFDCDPATVRRVVDPAYARLRRDQINEARRRRRDSDPHRSPHSVCKPSSFRHYEQYRPKPEDVRARLKEIPEDTRSFTQQFFGDPLPGRSALDRRQSRSWFNASEQ